MSSQQVRPFIRSVPSYRSLRSPAHSRRDQQVLWWPLHLSGWLLAVGFIPLLLGAALLSREEVELTVLPAWIPLTAAGIVVLICTFRSRDRIDR